LSNIKCFASGSLHSGRQFVAGDSRLQVCFTRVSVQMTSVQCPQQF
jgi:hypothetical protein